MARRAIFFAWVASAAAIALQTAGLGLQEHASVVSRFPPVLEVHELLPALKNNTAPRWLLNDEDACAAALSLDQVQLLNAHNTYHAPPELDVVQQILAVLAGSGKAQPRDVQRMARRLELSYPSFADVILSTGVSVVELDVWKDTQGGRFRYSGGKKIGTGDGDLGAAMAVPGWKIMHIPDVDYNALCHTLDACLLQLVDCLARWDAPLPLIVSVEYKAGSTAGDLDQTAGAPVSEYVNGVLQGTPGLPTKLTVGEDIEAGDWADIEATFLQYIPRSKIVAPGDLRIEAGQVLWPSLADLRGKVFLLSDGVAQEQVGPTSLFHRVWLASDELDASGVLQDPTPDKAFVTLYAPPEANVALAKQVLAQRRIIVAIAGLMDVPPSAPGDTGPQPASLTASQARQDLEAWTKLGVGIIKTDFVVPQRSDARAFGLDGKLWFGPESLPSVVYNTTVVAQCNAATLDPALVARGCCVPNPVAVPAVNGRIGPVFSSAASLRGLTASSIVGYLVASAVLAACLW